MRGIPAASGTAGVQLVSGPATVYGYSIRDNAATAAVATVVLRDGTSSSAPAVAFIELPADGSRSERLPGLQFQNGVFVDRAAGTSEIILYVT